MIEDDQADKPIRDFIRNQTDIEIDKYSDTGANGELYFGIRKVLKDRVALKFYYYNSHISSHQEPLLLKEIKDPNILEIYDAKIINNQYAYFLTPEISGGDLEKFISANNIPTKTAISITQDILKGLSVLHQNQNNLVHRDLKPNNILIDNISLTAYIADFGSIKKIPEAKDSVVASKNTFIYKPFESIIDEIYFKESDIYQVGIILFQLLHGNFPAAPADWLNTRQRKRLEKIDGNFEQWNFIEECINEKIVRGKLLNYDTLPHYIHPRLKTIIRTATRTDRKRRYQSCAEFLKALFDFQKNGMNWWQENNIIYATNIHKKEFKISKDPKSSKTYILEDRKPGNTWRKNNNHNGKLQSIIESLN